MKICLCKRDTIDRKYLPLWRKDQQINFFDNVDLVIYVQRINFVINVAIASELQIRIYPNFNIRLLLFA